MKEKCYGSTSVSKTESHGSTPCSFANTMNKTKIVKVELENGLAYGYYVDNYSFLILHRDPKDGPAYEQYSGRKIWYNHGERHREDGPAIIHPNKKTEYCINGKYVTGSAKAWLKERNIDEHNMSDEDKLALTFFIRSLC